VGHTTRREFSPNSQHIALGDGSESVSGTYPLFAYLLNSLLPLRWLFPQKLSHASTTASRHKCSPPGITTQGGCRSGVKVMRAGKYCTSSLGIFMGFEQ
jgi:hypothetical protein